MKILLIIFMITIILICLFKKRRESFYNSIKLEIQNSKHFNNYINSIDENMKGVKVKNYTKKNNFKKKYLEYLSELNETEKKNIFRLTKICDQKLRNLNLKIFFKYPWKFLKSNNNLEMGMPFTVHDTIIIPQNFFNKIRNGQYIDNLLDTLIHEKIHVIQRFNQDKFNSYYLKIYPFLNQKINSIPNKFHKNNMVNPDSNNQYWTYKFNNNIYFVYLKYHNGKVFSHAINKYGSIGYLNILKTKYDFELNTSIYHPNEIFACEVAHQIMSKKVSEKYLKFLHSF